MKHGLALLALVALAGCATLASVHWALANDYTLTIADDPSQQRFDVTLTSKAKMPLCLSKEAWPATEALPAGFGGATLTTSAGTLDLLPTATAYCPGSCGEVRLEPGQQVEGHIPYSAFGDAAAIAADRTRSLVFQIYPYQCIDG